MQQLILGIGNDILWVIELYWTTLKQEKNKHRFGILRILYLFVYVWQN